MKLDEAAKQLIVTRRNEGHGWEPIAKELRTQGYTQLRGGKLTGTSVYNFINNGGYANRKAKHTTGATNVPAVPYTFVVNVLESKWSANKKLSVLKAAYQNY